MTVEIKAFEKGDALHISMGRGSNEREAILDVAAVDDEPDGSDMLHEPVLFLECETERGTACRVEKLEDGRVRFRYAGSDSPIEVHAAWGKRDPEWDGVPA